METPEDGGQAPNAETPETPQTDEPTVDWSKRYNDLRPEFDRTNQELSHLNRLLEAARNGDPQAAEALGFAYADNDTIDDDGEEPGQYLTREEWQQYQAQQAQQQ